MGPVKWGKNLDLILLLFIEFCDPIVHCCHFWTKTVEWPQITRVASTVASLRSPRHYMVSHVGRSLQAMKPLVLVQQYLSLPCFRGVRHPNEEFLVGVVV